MESFRTDGKFSDGRTEKFRTDGRKKFGRTENFRTDGRNFFRADGRTDGRTIIEGDLQFVFITVNGDHR